MSLSSTEEDWSSARHFRRAMNTLAASGIVVDSGIFHGLADVPPLAVNQPHPRYFP
jgi:hypothetical protein